MHAILQVMARNLNPITCHLSEELNSFATHIDPATTECASVLKLGWYAADPHWHQPDLAQRWEAIRAVRRVVYKAIDTARDQGVVDGIPDAHVRLVVTPSLAALLTSINTDADMHLNMPPELDNLILSA